MILIRAEFQCKWGWVDEAVAGFKAMSEWMNDQDDERTLERAGRQGVGKDGPGSPQPGLPA